MLRTNKQIVTAFRRFNRPTRGEISDKIMKALAVSESMVTKRFDKASFTLEERKKVDKILEPYFEIMPEVFDQIKTQ